MIHPKYHLTNNSVNQALHSVYVNIYDLIDAKASGTRVRTFSNRQQLATYSIKNNKIYPKRKAKEGGPVKLLLREIF